MLVKNLGGCRVTNSFIASQSFQSSQHCDIKVRILAERDSALARELMRRKKGVVPMVSNDAKKENSS